MPAGGVADISVAGPSGFLVTLTADTVLRDLPAGTYTVSSREITASGRMYRPRPATIELVLGEGAPAEAQVSYLPVRPGKIRIAAMGLPEGGSVTWELQHRGGQIATGGRVAAGADEVHDDIEPGAYTITYYEELLAAGITRHLFAPEVHRRVIEVSETGVLADATARYRQITGAVLLSTRGLPEGFSATYRIRTPEGTVITSGNVLTGRVRVASIAAGPYVVEWLGRSAEVPGGRQDFAPVVARLPIEVKAVLDPVDGSMDYVPVGSVYTVP